LKNGTGDWGLGTGVSNESENLRKVTVTSHSLTRLCRKRYIYCCMGNRKSLILLFSLFFLLYFDSCATRDGYSADSLTLDAAIDGTASYFTSRIPPGAKVALVPFDSPASLLSDYVFEELWRRFEDSGRFVMVDRRNLERIDAEIKHQYETGRVDDAQMVSITKQYGAQTLVHGHISAIGQGALAPEYRITVYATDVEKASSSQRAFIVKRDSRLSSLLNASADDEVERAVLAMARSVDQKTIIAVGRINYADTQTVTNLSAWLKNSIIAEAQKYRDKFQVAAESEIADFAITSRGMTVETPVTNTGIQAVIIGNYSHLDSNAEVLLQLVSLGASKMVLASERFIITAAELERRKLSLLPVKGSSVIDKAEFEAKQKAIAPYSGKDNKWTFTVTPDALDGIYREGGYMSMLIYSERDCYFRVIHIDVNGNAQIIYPVSANDNNFIRAGQTRRIPDNTRFRMGPPFGEEIILAAAYERPFTLNAQFGAVPLSADTLTRSLSAESDGNKPMSPSATARFSYSILPIRN